MTFSQTKSAYKILQLSIQVCISEPQFSDLTPLFSGYPLASRKLLSLTATSSLHGDALLCLHRSPCLQGQGSLDSSPATNTRKLWRICCKGTQQSRFGMQRKKPSPQRQSSFRADAHRASVPPRFQFTFKATS